MYLTNKEIYPSELWGNFARLCSAQALFIWSLSLSLWKVCIQWQDVFVSQLVQLRLSQFVYSNPGKGFWDMVLISSNWWKEICCQRRLVYVLLLSDCTIITIFPLFIPPCLRVCVHMCLFLQVWTNFLSMFTPEYRRTTYMMMAVWFSMSFRYDEVKQRCTTWDLQYTLPSQWRPCIAVMWCLLA